MASRKRASTLPAFVGVDPHRVWVGPRADKKGVIYLRWRRGDNWAWKSLKFALGETTGAERSALEQRAYEAALDKYQRLSGQRAEQRESGRKPVTIGGAWKILTHPKTGRFPTPSAYRDELAAALRTAGRVLGEDFPLMAFDLPRLREVTRWKVDEVMRGGSVGFRSAEVLGTRLLSICKHLQLEGMIPEHVVFPGGKGWHQQLRDYVESVRNAPIPEPSRPRFTLDEFRRLLAASREVDPRFELLVALGAELRPGQVVRAWRSDLDLAVESFVVHGRGKKGGTEITLTAGQRETVLRAMTSGYLQKAEMLYQLDRTNYRLFPGTLIGGQAPSAQQGHVLKKALTRWWRQCEQIAGLKHRPGLGFYGMRRTSTDASLDGGISEEALQNLHGWSSDRMAKELYRDRQRPKVQREAQSSRARTRGELSETGDGVPQTYPEKENPRSTE